MSAAEMLDIGLPECRPWRNRIFKRHLWLSSALKTSYIETAKREGYVEANQLLSRIECKLKLGGTGLYADCADQRIKDYANAKSKNLECEFWQWAKRTSKEFALQHVVRAVSKAGLTFPLDIKKSDDAETIKRKTIAALARVFDPKWWRRRLRPMAARQVEQVCRELGMVGRSRGVYVSHYTLQRRGEQKNRNRQLLLSLEAENETGYCATLAELADSSVSNPVNRRNELMVRIRGYEEVAQSMSFTGVFLTLTAPSKYHAVLHAGGINSKYNGACPRETNDYLNGVWSRVRAAWHRRGIRPFGFRFAEPHHDGTPHWHMLLFVESDRLAGATELFRDYALSEDGDEAGADKYRFESVVIDWERGSAAGYVAKYVSKNIDGFEVGADYEAQDESIKTARRVEAWASTWGIRQFQQIGSVSVTVWRELRRCTDELENITAIELEKIRAAADAGNWSEFVQLMGGALVNRDAQAVRALHVMTDTENQYGEAVSRLKGVLMRGVASVITRVHTWEVRPVSNRCDKGQVAHTCGQAP